MIALLFSCVLGLLAPASPATSSDDNVYLVVANTTTYKLNVEAEILPALSNSVPSSAEVPPLMTKALRGLLVAGRRARVTVTIHVGDSRRVMSASRDIFVNNPGPGQPPPMREIVVEYHDELTTRELTGKDKAALDLRQADLIIENNTEYPLDVILSWKFDPSLPSINEGAAGGVGAMSERRFSRYVYIGRTKLKLTAMSNGKPIKTIEKSIYLNNPGPGKPLSAQRVVVTDSDFGGLPLVEGRHSGPKTGVWDTKCIHEYGGFKGQIVPAIMTLSYEGDQMIMSWGEYRLRGTLSGNAYTFTVTRNGGHHGKGQFTFSGNSFTGTWSDDFQKGGSWTGQFRG